ncbi:MAG TPA: bestrophin family ion channel [Chroococcales cyanobacterium]
MYVRGAISPSVMLWFCWKHVLFFVAYSFAVYVAYHKLGWKFVGIPFLPVGTIGTAVAFYVGFKNNSSYERLWEARKIWESVATLCRAFGALVVSLPDCDRLLREKLVRRQFAWCNLLRLQLRATRSVRNSNKVPPEVALVKKVFGDAIERESVASYVSEKLTEEDRSVAGQSTNPAFSMLQLQARDLAALLNSAPASELPVQKLLDITVDCMKEQGSAERLKSFPFPRQYAYFSQVFVWIFLILLPFGLIEEVSKATLVDWLVVPFSTLLSWMFLTMEQVGDSSEDPFEMGLNDIPMTAMCTDIEIELLHFLGESETPAPVYAVADILM